MTPVRFTIASACAIVLLAAPDAAQHAGIAPAEYQSRRSALAKAIGPDALFVAFSSEPARRTGDVEWPFRQEDNLLYLTGLNEPDTTLVLLPGERERRETIFSRDRDPSNERWTGIIPSKEQVTARTGIRDVASSRRFNQFLDALFQGRGWDAPPQSGYLAPPAMPAFLAASRAGRAAVWLVQHDRGALSGGMTREQRFADDLRRQYPRRAVPRRVAAVAGHARDQEPGRAHAHSARDRRHSGGAEGGDDARAHRDARVRGPGDHRVHVPQSRRLLLGIPVDRRRRPEFDDPPLRDEQRRNRAGRAAADRHRGEIEGYGADVTRTYPADGSFSPEQRAIYEAVLAAQTESLALMRPGHRHLEANNKAIEVVGRELLRLGLVTKATPEQAALYLFHATGHPLGLQTHDVYDRARAYEPGMVFTNEPGIYVRKDDILASEIFKQLPPAEQAAMPCRGAALRRDRDPDRR